MKRSHSADLDDIRSCSSDVGSHTVQEIRNVNHMGLLGHIFHNRCSLGQRRSHHHIDGRSDSDNIKVQMCAAQMICLSHNLAVLDVHVRAQRPEPFEMLVNRPACRYCIRPGRATSAFPVFSQKRPQQIIGRPYLFNIIIFDIKTVIVLPLIFTVCPVNTLLPSLRSPG